MAFPGWMVTLPQSTHLSIPKPGGLQLAATRIYPFQMRCEGNSNFAAPKKPSFSRRDAIISLTGLSATTIGVSLPGIAEARIKKAEMRRKIKEKLELLRRKAGVSKPNESDKGPSTKEQYKLQLQPPPFPLPEPSIGRDRSLVEATYDL